MPENRTSRLCSLADDRLGALSRQSLLA